MIVYPCMHTWGNNKLSSICGFTHYQLVLILIYTCADTKSCRSKDNQYQQVQFHYPRCSVWYTHYSLWSPHTLLCWPCSRSSSFLSQIRRCILSSSLPQLTAMPHFMPVLEPTSMKMRASVTTTWTTFFSVSMLQVPDSSILLHYVILSPCKVWTSMFHNDLQGWYRHFAEGSDSIYLKPGGWHVHIKIIPLDYSSFIRSLHCVFW